MRSPPPFSGRNSVRTEGASWRLKRLQNRLFLCSRHRRKSPLTPLPLPYKNLCKHHSPRGSISVHGPAPIPASERPRQESRNAQHPEQPHYPRRLDGLLGPAERSGTTSRRGVRYGTKAAEHTVPGHRLRGGCQLLSQPALSFSFPSGGRSKGLAPSSAQRPRLTKEVIAVSPWPAVGGGGARPGEAVAASGKERINQSRTRRRKGFDILLFFLARLAKEGETQNAENIDEERIARRWRPLRPRVPRPSSAVQKGR